MKRENVPGRNEGNDKSAFSSSEGSLRCSYLMRPTIPLEGHHPGSTPTVMKKRSGTVERIPLKGIHDLPILASQQRLPLMEPLS